MKVELNFNQRSYSGKLNDLIYYWVPELQQMIARRRPLPQTTREHNLSFGRNSNKLSSLIQNPEFKTDLKLYLGLLKDANLNDRANRWFALYNRMIWAFLRKHPEWSVASLTHETILVEGLSCRSVKTAVEDGLLPMVEGYQRFDNLI